MSYREFLSILLVFLWTSPWSGTAAAQDSAVRWAGALKNVHHGIDYSGQIDLKDLADLEHLYAVGPVEGLKGEITIWDGSPLISEIEGEKLWIKRTFNRKACFLVYAQVAQWQAIAIPKGICGENISKMLRAVARRYKHPTDKPFTFLIKGKARMVRFHVLSKRDANQPDGTTDQHERAKVVFSLVSQPVEILGFYSEHHQGVFTHRGSFVHLHVKMPDETKVGHVEILEMEPDSVLYLPLKS
jgi:acetolactate decarboxylase